MNPTFQKFNYPASLARDYVHWAVGLIRPWHLTLGGLIIAEKSDATALSQLDPEAFLEFGRVCRDAEGVLARAFQYDKVNYVSLMMAGHQRTLPCHPALRLGARVSQCRIYRDAGWPKPPDMTFTQPANPEQLEALRKSLVDLWP
jgi:diadenosine tetraphosphate (Ap4A) HIT family hydrolase